MRPVQRSTAKADSVSGLRRQHYSCLNASLRDSSASWDGACKMSRSMVHEFSSSWDETTHTDYQEDKWSLLFSAVYFKCASNP